MTEEKALSALKSALKTWQSMPLVKQQLVQFSIAQSVASLMNQQQLVAESGMAELAESFQQTIDATHAAGTVLAAFSVDAIELSRDRSAAGLLYMNELRRRQEAEDECERLLGLLDAAKGDAK